MVVRGAPSHLPPGGPAAPSPARPGRYLRRLRVVPDPEYGLEPAARIGAGEMLFPPGASFGPRKQTGYEIILLRRGGLVIEVDGTGLRLRPDEVTLLRPGQRCVFRFEQERESLVRYIITYDPTLPRPLLDALDGPPFLIPASAAMAGLMDAVLALAAPPAPRPAARPAAPRTAAAPLWLATAGIALFVDEARAAGKIGARPATPEHPAITAAREVVRRRLGERIGLKDLAAAAHVAPEYLVRLFRGRLGTTPVRYLWAARVRLGIYLLEYSDLPVAQVAERVGCRSPKHFSRLVRAELGLPPGEVRRRSWSYPATASSGAALGSRPRPEGAWL